MGKTEQSEDGDDVFTVHHQYSCIEVGLTVLKQLIGAGDVHVGKTRLEEISDLGQLINTTGNVKPEIYSSIEISWKAYGIKNS